MEAGKPGGACRWTNFCGDLTCNTFLAPFWNREHIESVQITMTEDFGVLGRSGFYEQTGTIRDVWNGIICSRCSSDDGTGGALTTGHTPSRRAIAGDVSAGHKRLP